MKARWVLLVGVLMWGCVESNPQPSPAGPDVAGGGAPDVVADVGGTQEGDDAVPADTVDTGPPSDDVDRIDTVTPPDTIGSCEPPKPILFDDTCVECLTTADCDEDIACNPQNHRCEPEECNYCETPYPACTQIDGVWSCVQCKYDEDCSEGTKCEPDLYACVGSVPPPCPGCATDDDCQSLWSDLQLECDVASGCCQDVTGLCDGVEGFCPNGECKGLWEDYLGCGVWPTSENEGCENIDPKLGLCTCSTPVDLEDPSSCPPPEFCAGGACPPEAVCVDASVVELMFGASAPFEGGVCLPLEWMLSDL